MVNHVREEQRSPVGWIRGQMGTKLREAALSFHCMRRRGKSSAVSSSMMMVLKCRVALAKPISLEIPIRERTALAVWRIRTMGQRPWHT
jgi:hypothetical protein